MHETTSFSENSVLNLAMNENVENVQKQSWENTTLPLSEWHKNQLHGLQSVSGIECLLQTWFVYQRILVPGK